MSTKATIEYDENFHFYEEVFDSENVYLELTGENAEDFNFSIHQGYIVLSIPRKVWAKIKNKDVGDRPTK